MRSYLLSGEAFAMLVMRIVTEGPSQVLGPLLPFGYLVASDRLPPGVRIVLDERRMMVVGAAQIFDQELWEELGHVSGTADDKGA